MSFNVKVEGGKTVKLPTAGKYCDRDIIVTAADGGHEDEILTAEIVEYDNDRITTIAPYSFTHRNNLLRVSLAALKDAIGGSVFSRCESLQRVELPNYEGRYNGYFFFNDPQLVFVDFGSVERICTKVFRKCDALETLILRRSTLVQMVNANAFDGVANATVYVPEALIEEYEDATNWSSLCASGTVTFAALEGSEYE